MTDTVLIQSYLQTNLNQWHNAIDLMKDLKPGCVNWALRSRVSDLNKTLPSKGFHIESRIGKNRCAEYRLVSLKPVQMKLDL
mgnify:CR=1 FL=1